MGTAPRADEAEAAHLVEVALRYADHGWPVVPLHTPQGGSCSCRGDECTSRGKHPRTPRGLHDASTDAGRIAAWCLLT
jgi:hypothetical protein